MKTLLWLDDMRNPFDESIWLETYSPLEQPYDCIWVKSYQEFVDWITEHSLPDAICFDHDLGMVIAMAVRAEGASKRESRKLKGSEKTGYDCAKWLVEYCMDNDVPLPLWSIQSANPVGKENIKGLLLSFSKHRG